MAEISEAVEVREARREDMAAVHALIHELAIFEGVPDGPRLSVEDLIEDGFESSPAWFFALVAEAGGALAGYALCNRAYSSWTRRALYLEDLFVLPAMRRRGVASALMRKLCQIAVEVGAHRVDWHVLTNNTGSLALYRALGAVDLREAEGRAALRLHRPEIERAARSQQTDKR